MKFDWGWGLWIAAIFVGHIAVPEGQPVWHYLCWMASLLLSCFAGVWIGMKP